MMKFFNYLLLLTALCWAGNMKAAYTPSVTESEVSVFLETSCDNAKVWAWNSAANHSSVSWPGDAMTLVGQTDEGKNVFKWTYDGGLDMPTGIIFTHDGQTKFVKDDLDYVNHGYYVEGVYSKTIDATPAGKVMVYFDNTTAQLSEVYCYLYQGTTASVEWPGTLMTFDETATYGDKTGWYTLEVPQEFVTGHYVINNGKNGVSLEGETVYVDGKDFSSVERIEASTVEAAKDDGAWYTITGIRLTDKPSQAGLYIHNGKKIIIRQ